MTLRKLNLGMTALVAGLLLAPATETVALCAPKPGTAALNLVESDFTIPTQLRGTRWRIRFRSAAGGVSVKVTIRGRTVSGIPTTTTEEITLAPNSSRTTNREYLIPTSVRTDRAAGADISIEWELVGVAAAVDGSAVLDGVCTSSSPVPRWNSATFVDSGNVLVKMADTETLAPNGWIVAAAGGAGRMKQMADTGGTIGRCQSGSFISRDGNTFINCAVDPR